MRVPFPIRVLLSYLLVLVVGFLPTYIYLEVLFQERVASHEVKQLIMRTSRQAARLAALSPAQRLVDLRHLAGLSHERITYIDAQGKVLYDSVASSPRKLDNHLLRTEVRLALGVKDKRLPFDPKIAGVGVAQRISKSTGRDSLYVAMLINQQSGQQSSLLRLTIPVSRIKALKRNLIQVFRNSLAAAISVALVLSLLSAVVFMRPLQETSQAAQALARGDYSSTLTKFSNDEIGDVARSLQTLSVELRHRLAMAEASEALLFQLVQIDRTPLAVFNEKGSIRALNGAARMLLETRKADAKEVLGRWQTSRQYQRVWELAEETEEPQEVAFEVEEGGREVRGLMHLIKHPSGASFGVFMGLPGVRERFSFLPPATEVRSIPVSQVLESGIQRAGPVMERFGISVIRPHELGPWMVADVQDRLAMTLASLLKGAASTTPEGQNIALQLEEDALFISLSFEARIPNHVAEVSRLLLEPIGGKIQLEANTCLLKWPRA